MKENSPDKENILKSLNELCFRLVFCIYAEDAGLFGKKVCSMITWLNLILKIYVEQL